MKKQSSNLINPAEELFQTWEDFDLFESSSGFLPFVVIESDLLQLADYSRETLENTKKKYDSLKSNDKSDWQDPEIDYLHFWEDNLSFLAPSMVLVLIYLFTEKSLKDLCYYFTPGVKHVVVPAGEKFKVPKKHNESIVDASLRYLCELDEFSFELDDSYSIVFEKVRLLRNNFAHGDWENVRIILSEISVKKGIEIISNLFRTIEQGMNETK